MSRAQLASGYTATPTHALTTSIHVADMHCASCSSKITSALQADAEIYNVRVNPLRRDVFITHNNKRSARELVNAITRLGFAPSLRDVVSPDIGRDRLLLKRLGVAGLCMMQVMMAQIALYAGAFQNMDSSYHQLLGFAALIFSIPVVTFSAVPFFRSGFGSLSRGGNMDTPIALAVMIGFTLSLTNVLRGSGEVYFDSVTMFVFLMLGSRYLNERLRHKLQLEDQLMANLPRQVTKVIGTNQVHQQVALAEIKPGDLVWVAQGEMLPADGVLQSDHAILDASLLTGESEPSHLSQGELVFAGTMNQGPGILLTVSHTGDASRVAAIDRLANQAASAKHSLTRTTDRIARIFIPSILGLAALTFIYWSWADATKAVSATLAVLVVSCPCALSLAIPAAHIAALTHLRRLGILVRNSHVLERIAQIRTVFFDKTGTLTTSHPQLMREIPSPGFDADYCLQVAQALQHQASHPLSRAFDKATDQQSLAVTDTQVVIGQGITGLVDHRRARIGSAEFLGCAEVPASEGYKAIYLALDDELAAVFYVHAPLREDARSTVAGLKEAGFSVALISGDTSAHCRQIANELGISHLHGTSPEQKGAHLRAHEPCMFVGDGLNDLPALTTASVSIATFETVDLVKSKADLVLMSPALSSLVELPALAVRTRRVMHQNLLWAVAYNVIAIPLAASGLVAPWMAALGMSLSSLLVMVNATQLMQQQQVK